MNKAEIEKWFWSDCPHGGIAYTSDCQQCCLDLANAARVEGLRRAKQILLDSPQGIWCAQTDLIDAEIAALERGKG